MLEWEDIGFDENAALAGVKGWYWRLTDRQTWPIIAGDWESSHAHKIDKYVKNKEVVVQAGGNCGMYPRLLREVIGFKKIYTFEPCPHNFYVLNLNTPCKCIYKFNMALGERNKLISINERSKINHGETKIDGSGEPDIPMIKIDQLALEKCDFIWLDIEDSEHEAVMGAMETIVRCSPVLMFENLLATTQKALEEIGYGVVDKSGLDVILVRG